MPTEEEKLEAARKEIEAADKSGPLTKFWYKTIGGYESSMGDATKDVAKFAKDKFDIDAETTKQWFPKIAGGAVGVTAGYMTSGLGKMLFKTMPDWLSNTLGVITGAAVGVVTDKIFEPHDGTISYRFVGKPKEEDVIDQNKVAVPSVGPGNVNQEPVVYDMPSAKPWVIAGPPVQWASVRAVEIAGLSPSNPRAAADRHLAEEGTFQYQTWEEAVRGLDGFFSKYRDKDRPEVVAKAKTFGLDDADIKRWGGAPYPPPTPKIFIDHSNRLGGIDDVNSEMNRLGAQLFPNEWLKPGKLETVSDRLNELKKFNQKCWADISDPTFEEPKFVLAEVVVAKVMPGGINPASIFMGMAKSVSNGNLNPATVVEDGTKEMINSDSVALNKIMALFEKMQQDYEAGRKTGDTSEQLSRAIHQYRAANNRTARKYARSFEILERAALSTKLLEEMQDFDTKYHQPAREAMEAYVKSEEEGKGLLWYNKKVYEAQQRQDELGKYRIAILDRNVALSGEAAGCTGMEIKDCRDPSKPCYTMFRVEKRADGSYITGVKTKNGDTWEPAFTAVEAYKIDENNVAESLATVLAQKRPMNVPAQKMQIVNYVADAGIAGAYAGQGYITFTDASNITRTIAFKQKDGGFTITRWRVGDHNAPLNAWNNCPDGDATLTFQGSPNDIANLQKVLDHPALKTKTQVGMLGLPGLPMAMQQDIEPMQLGAFLPANTGAKILTTEKNSNTGTAV